MFVTSDPLRTSATRQVHTDGSVTIAGAEIRFRVEVLKAGFVLLTVSGGRQNRSEDKQAEALMLEELSAELKRSGSLTVFADMRESSKMGAQSRDIATDWLREHRDRIKGSHVLVRSKLIEMAMSIIGMLVGGGLLRVYSRPATFVDAIRASVPGFGKLPKL